MKFIDEHGKKINLDKFRYLGHGNCANTYHNNKIVFKKYKNDTRSDFKIRQEVFDILKDINNANFIKLYDTYMLTTLPERILYSINAINFMIDGYTTKFYQKESINPLCIDKDYLLSNLYEIEKLFNVISSTGIKVDDIFIDNIVYTKDRIIIIDPDFYRISKSKESEIKSWNKRNILILFQSMIEETIGLYHEERQKLISWFEDTFFEEKITDNTNVTEIIAKQLKYVKKPIDVIRK